MPMKTSSFEVVKKLYEDTAESYDKMMDTEIKLPVYSDTLSRLAKSITDVPGPIIDTSCGSGHMLQLYQERYDLERSLIGIDLSPRMIELTKERLGPKAKCYTGDMRRLEQIPSDATAAILSFFSIHHIDPTDVLFVFQEWYRVLCRRGQLVLGTWEGDGPIDYGEETDVVAFMYTKSAISGWVEEAGFDISRCVVEHIEEMQMTALYLEATKK